MPTRRRSFLYAGFVLAVVVLLAVTGYFLIRDKGQLVVPRPTAQKQLTTAIGVENFPTWRPDGTDVAYHSDRSGNLDIWVTQIKDGTTRNLTEDNERPDRFPSWSPDGSQIAFWSDRETGGRGYYVMSALGGIPQKLMNITSGRFRSPPAWSADGNS